MWLLVDIHTLLGSLLYHFLLFVFHNSLLHRFSIFWNNCRNFYKYAKAFNEYKRNNNNKVSSTNCMELSHIWLERKLLNPQRSPYMNNNNTVSWYKYWKCTLAHENGNSPITIKIKVSSDCSHSPILNREILILVQFRAQFDKFIQLLTCKLQSVDIAARIGNFFKISNIIYFLFFWLALFPIQCPSIIFLSNHNKQKLSGEFFTYTEKVTTLFFFSFSLAKQLLSMNGQK